MIRSRDFFLYMLVLVFLCLSIGVTVSLDILAERRSHSEPMVDFANSDTVNYSAWLDRAEFDRNTNLANLKAKIAKGEGLSAGAAILTSVDDQDSNNTQSGQSTTRAPQYCEIYDLSPASLATWPATGVATTFVEGARLVTVSEVSTETTGTTTRPTLKKRTLLQLPAGIVRQATDQCLDTVVVGVDVNGKLIRNTDTSRYAATNEFSLVGYARDGFPIYGFKADPSGLDSCGGIAEVTGYRYYLRSDEDFVLGCFAGQPVKFK